MLPKKRKFTASDYETFSASPSQGQEAPPAQPPPQALEAAPPRPVDGPPTHQQSQPAVSLTETRSEAPLASSFLHSSGQQERYSAANQYQQEQKYAAPTDYTTNRPGGHDASDSTGVMDLSNKSTSPAKPPVAAPGTVAIKVAGPSPIPSNKAVPLISSGRMQSPSFAMTSGRSSAGMPGSSGVQIRRLSNAEYSHGHLSANEEVAKHTAGGQGPKKFDINLKDWIGSRVLARRDQYFLPWGCEKCL